MQGSWSSVPYHFVGQKVLLRLAERHVSAFVEGERVGDLPVSAQQIVDGLAGDRAV